MSHAEQLERETEHAREQIANPLDELRTRMTPGYVLDQLADRMARVLRRRSPATCATKPSAIRCRSRWSEPA